MKDKTVLVAMSGGIDSSVAAYLLKKQGYQVTGVTMSFNVAGSDLHHEDLLSSHNDARKVCNILHIPHRILDLTAEFEQEVVNPFIREYLYGRTPNPCIICNRLIKFGRLFDYAVQEGFDFFATGHYARIEKIKNQYVLRKPRDRSKDQTYFLYNLRRETLEKILFPLADLTKEEARAIVRELDLPIGEKPESQDICFLPQGGYQDFIRNRTHLDQPGPIVDRQRKELGKHRGVYYYTVGQRKGLGISAPSALYVISIEPDRNTIVVGEKKDLYTRALIAHKLNFLIDNIVDHTMFAQTRYAHRESPCQIKLLNDTMRVIFHQKQENMTPGQSVVLYTAEGIVAGGGIIKEVIR